MTAPNYPAPRRRLVQSAAVLVNSRTFISINGNEPMGVRGELYRALLMMKDLVEEVRDMQAELDIHVSATEVIHVFDPGRTETICCAQDVRTLASAGALFSMNIRPDTCNADSFISFEGMALADIKAHLAADQEGGGLSI